ncbi:CoA-binding protein [Longispora albida]|uniref:CoA-binding protein n=1 Tax=Longispora albida TaxID=203523 RepID=UPI0003785525|nr:CoA-binding protein [Longispora albida]
MEIPEILELKTWAVVGLTSNPSRAAYRVARFLLDKGKQVIPVNPAGEAVHGQTGYRSLAEIPVPVDVVDVFRRSEDAGAHVDEAIGIGARAVWLQLGVIDEAAAERARTAGLAVVMDRCPAIEWRD